MDVTILAPVQGQQLPEIAWNYNEVKAWVQESLTNYQGRVYGPEQLKEAKADRAKLNHLKEALETRRREVKKLWNEPYIKFEAQMKECTGLIQECNGAIAEQINRAEDGERREKLGKIEDTFDAFCPAELAQLVELDRLMDPRWLNKSVSMEAVERELRTRLGQIKAGLAALRGIAYQQDEEAVVNRFLQDYDLEAALAYGKQLQNQRDVRQETAAKQQMASVPVLDAEHTPPPEPEPPAPTPEAAPLAPPAKDEPLLTLDFRVRGTRRQVSALKAWLKDNHIDYGRVPQN